MTQGIQGNYVILTTFSQCFEDQLSLRAKTTIESNFYKDLRSIGISNTSQSPSLFHPCPIPLLFGHCAIHSPLPQASSLPRSRLWHPVDCITGSFRSVGFGQNGASVEWELSEEAVYLSPLHLLCPVLTGHDSCLGLLFHSSSATHLSLCTEGGDSSPLL